MRQMLAQTTMSHRERGCWTARSRRPPKNRETGTQGVPPASGKARTHSLRAPVLRRPRPEFSLACGCAKNMRSSAPGRTAKARNTPPRLLPLPPRTDRRGASSSEPNQSRRWKPFDPLPDALERNRQICFNLPPLKQQCRAAPSKTLQARCQASGWSQLRDSRSWRRSGRRRDGTWSHRQLIGRRKRAPGNLATFFSGAASRPTRRAATAL